MKDVVNIVPSLLLAHDEDQWEVVWLDVINTSSRCVAKATMYHPYQPARDVAMVMSQSITITRANEELAIFSGGERV